MANDTVTKPAWLTPEVLVRIREIEYDLHVHALENRLPVRPQKERPGEPESVAVTRT